MQNDSFPFGIPNTYRDSNDMRPTRDERILPSAPSVEEMDFSNETRHSIIRPVESDNSLSPRINPLNQNRMINRPYARSIIQASENDNEQPEPLFNGTTIGENHNSMLEAAGFDPNQLGEIDADAAYALQLQQEEYTRESLIPNRRRYVSRGLDPDIESNEIDLPIFPNSDTPRFTNDEEFAAYLQQQEDRNRQRYHQGPFPFHQTRRRNPPLSQTAETDETENDPSPLIRFTQRSQNDDEDDDDDENPHINGAHAFLQFLANSGHPMAEGGIPPFFRGMRRGRRTGNLQDTEEDFGPEDYERLLQLDDSVHKKKLDKRQIESIKRIQFRSKANNTDEENKCGVCLELFEEDQVLRQFPCEHVYHKDCADRWLQESNACPICRKPPIDNRNSSNSRYQRGSHYPRRSSMPNRNPSNRNYNSTNSSNTHRRGHPPNRQS